MNLNELPENWKRQAQAQLAHRNPISTGSAKSDRSNALGKASEIQKLSPPVYIRITVYKRGTTWDADNIPDKGIVDAFTDVIDGKTKELLREGVIKKDTVEYVPRVTKEGVIVKTKAEEKTVIDIYEI